MHRRVEIANQGKRAKPTLRKRSEEEEEEEEKKKKKEEEEEEEKKKEEEEEEEEEKKKRKSSLEDGLDGSVEHSCFWTRLEEAVCIHWLWGPYSSWLLSCERS